MFQYGLTLGRSVSMISASPSSISNTAGQYTCFDMPRVADLFECVDADALLDAVLHDEEKLRHARRKLRHLMNAFDNLLGPQARFQRHRIQTFDRQHRIALVGPIKAPGAHHHQVRLGRNRRPVPLAAIRSFGAEDHFELAISANVEIVVVQIVHAADFGHFIDEPRLAALGGEDQPRDGASVACDAIGEVATYGRVE